MGWWIFFSSFFKLRVMGTIQWEAVLTEPTEQWSSLLGPSLEKMMALLGWAWGRIRRQLWGLLRSLSSRRGFCDPALVPGSVRRVGSPAWG